MDSFDLEALKRQLKKAIAHFEGELGKLRTGRADTSLIRNLMVNYYGSKVELYQIAKISVPEPRSLEIKPFNKDDVKDILKSFTESNLDLNPSEGEGVIRIALTPLTTDQKQLVIRKAKGMGEDAKISIRNTRRKAMNRLEENETSENEKKRNSGLIQKEVDNSTREITKLLKEKIEAIEKI